MVAKQSCPRCEGHKIEKIKLPDGRLDIRPCTECHGIGFKVKVVDYYSA